MGLDPQSSNLGSLVSCLLQLLFSVPIIKRLVFSLPTPVPAHFGYSKFIF